MRNLVFVFLCFLCSLRLSAQHIEDNSRLLDSLLDKHKNMHFYQSPTLGRADSVWHSGEHFYLYFDTDSICRQFVRKGGFNAVFNEMVYLYFSVFTELTPERRAYEIEKMEKIAKELKSEALMREVEFQKVFHLSNDSDEQFEYRLKRMRELQLKTEKCKDTITQIRIMENILYSFYYTNRVFEALEEAADILKLLNKITDKQYAGRCGLYFFIAEIYYLHGYYDEAIPLLKKILKSTYPSFNRSKLRALNTLGLYYRNEKNIDLSDEYFRAILKNPDNVQYKGEYDAIAICNLGKNYLLRKEYKKAEFLLQKGLPVMIHFDPTFPMGIYIALGDCYIAQRKLQQAKTMIDSAQKYFNKYPVWGYPDMELYRLKSKYYSITGNAKASIAYMDSAILIHNEYKNKYNISSVFQIEKKLYEAEKNAKEEQLKVAQIKKEKYRNILIACLLIFFISISFYILYTQLRKRKNRVLYKRIMEESRIQTELSEARHLLVLQSEEKQVEKTENSSENGYAKTNKNTLLQRLDELMKTEQLFINPDISRKMLANRLSTNENYLANAIRDGYNGQSFSDYINTLRLSHARQLLQEKSELSIKEISIEAGFASYKYFHQLFREEFGMSPSDFRNCL